MAFRAPALYLWSIWLVTWGPAGPKEAVLGRILKRQIKFHPPEFHAIMVIGVNLQLLLWC